MSTTPSPAPPPAPSPAPAPSYAATIKVSQAGPGLCLTGLLGLSMLCAVPGFWLAVQFDADATGWRALSASAGMFAGIALAMVGMVAGMIFWFVLEQRYLRWRGVTLFSATTPVRADARGLTVEGLGVCAWGDVLSHEGIPDSGSALIVHTRPYGRLLVEAELEALLPVLDHHLEAARESGLRAARADAALRFRALVFHWPRFLLWIAAGYLLGGAAVLGLLYNAQNAGFFKTLVGLALLPAMSAWLIWTIPFWQLSLFSPGRTRAFELRGAALQSSDGAWRIDLREARVRYRVASGIGYRLEFFSIRPARGKRLDLVLEAPERTALLGALNALGLPGFGPPGQAAGAD